MRWLLHVSYKHNSRYIFGMVNIIASISAAVPWGSHKQNWQTIEPITHYVLYMNDARLRTVLHDFFDLLQIKLFCLQLRFKLNITKSIDIPSKCLQMAP